MFRVTSFALDWIRWVSEGSLNSETSDIGGRGEGLIISYEKVEITLLTITCERRSAYALK